MSLKIAALRPKSENCKFYENNLLSIYTVKFCYKAV